MPVDSDAVPSVKFTCPKCGATEAELAVTDGCSDDSVASCKNCGQVFGRWADVKAKAVEVMKAEWGLPDALKNIFKSR